MARCGMLVAISVVYGDYSDHNGIICLAAYSEYDVGRADNI